MIKKLKIMAGIVATTVLLGACGQQANQVTDTQEVQSTGGTESSSVSESVSAQGLMSTFTTTDLDGETVDQSVLKDYKLTMVNIWATYCGPCLREMPELGELATEYESKGVQIIGIVADTYASDGSISDSQVTLAKDIVVETGANYLHLLPSDDLYGMLTQAYAVPTTMFFDSNGVQIGSSVVGSKDKAGWEKIIDQMLTEVE